MGSMTAARTRQRYTADSEGAGWTLQSLALIARWPAMHGLPAYAPLACHLTHRPTVGDDRQNCLYLCSVTLISLMAAERRLGTEVAVANQPKVVAQKPKAFCRLAAELAHSFFSNSHGSSCMSRVTRTQGWLWT